MTLGRTWRGRSFLAMSLDGFIARPDGDVRWLESLPTDRGHVTTSAANPALVWETFFPDMDALVMGRNTYEKVLTFGDWPFPGLTTLVLSSALDTDDDNIELVRTVNEAAERLAARGAREVYVDGGVTIRSFLRRGLIDELTVSIAPMILGEGVPLFGEGTPERSLRVRGSHVTAEGLVRITYDLV